MVRFGWSHPCGVLIVKHLCIIALSSSSANLPIVLWGEEGRVPAETLDMHADHTTSVGHEMTGLKVGSKPYLLCQTSPPPRDGPD